MNTPTRMVGYVRVSTDEQARSGLGIAAQRRAIRSEATRRGWTLVEVIADEGASGKDLDRPGLHRALSLIASGEADGLVVAKLDRASRSLVDAAALFDWLKAAGAAFVTLDLGIDTTTASGRLVANVMASVAEWERETIRLRTREALAAKRARGERVGGPAVTDRPELAARIRKLRARGWTFQRIADTLNREGVPTARGGTRWRVSSVQGTAGYRRPDPLHRPTQLPRLPRRRARGAA